MLSADYVDRGLGVDSHLYDVVKNAHVYARASSSSGFGQSCKAAVSLLQLDQRLIQAWLGLYRMQTIGTHGLRDFVPAIFAGLMLHAVDTSRHITQRLSAAHTLEMVQLVTVLADLSFSWALGFSMVLIATVKTLALVRAIDRRVFTFGAAKRLSAEVLRCLAV